MVRPPVLRLQSLEYAECVALLEIRWSQYCCASGAALGDAVVAVRLASSRPAEDTSYVLLDEPGALEDEGDKDRARCRVLRTY